MNETTEHTHEWTAVHEQGIVGGTFLNHWECEICGKTEAASVDPWKLTVSGIRTTRTKLVGPHGCRVTKADGTTCKAANL